MYSASSSPGRYAVSSAAKTKERWSIVEVECDPRTQEDDRAENAEVDRSLKADLAKSAPVVPTPASRPCPGRVLRKHGASESGCQRHPDRCSHDRRAGVGKPMMQKVERRFAIRTLASTRQPGRYHPRADAGTDRRASARPDQGREDRRRAPRLRSAICVAMPTARSRMLRRTRRSPRTSVAPRTTCRS